MCVPLLLGDGDYDDALLCPMLDARRMEVYAAIYDRALRQVVPTSAVVVDENAFRETLDGRRVVFFGTGADKCRSVITHPNALFVEGIEPLAKDMAPLATKRFFRGEHEDVAYFVPFYLKEFQAIKPKKLI